MVRTYIKRVHGAVESNDAEAAGTALSQAMPIIDKMVSKGIMHKNQAARTKVPFEQAREGSFRLEPLFDAAG
jgi:small subunit ribosomal protein S20